MAYQILEKESIDITHIDQAVLHNFIANNQSGIIGGYANECSLTSMGNTLIISTGMLLINGVRIKISEVESVVLSSTPTQDTAYQLIAQLTIDSNQAPSFEFIARTPQALIKNPIGQDGGVGVYQLELARFTHATDGTIKNIVRTANVLYGATNADLNEIRASVQDARSQAQAVYGLASNAVATSAAAQATSAAAQATAQEANQIAQQAQEDVRGIEINVAEERGTVVTVNGQPKAQVEWNDKLDKTPKEPKVVSDAFTSRITATNDVEIIDSPLGVKTATIKSIKGLSIKAIQRYGDFRTGALNDWSANAGYALSISNNILTVTVNTDTPGQVVLTNNVQAQPDRAHFIMCYVKTIAAISVQVGFSDGVKSVAKTTTAYQWTYVSSKLSINALSNPQIIVDCSSMTNGDSFQVCLFEVIDLEESGIQDWTNEKLDATIPLLEYFEGIYHSNFAQLKSVGDNLLVFDNYNKTETVNGMTLTTYPDGRIKLNGTATAGTSIFLFGNAAVSSAFNAQAISCFKGQRVKYVPNVISGTYYNGSISFVCHTSSRYAANNLAFGRAITGVGTGVLAGDITGFRIYFTAGATADNLVLQPMLLHADNPLTDYKPYTENVLQLPQYTLRSLPDGTADEIDLTNKTYIKRVGKIVIDGSQEVAQHQAVSVGGTYSFYVTIPNYKNKSNTDYVPNILADRLRTLGGVTAWDKTYTCVAPNTNGRIVVRDYFLSNAVADAKAYLAQNPITLWFELDEPIIEPLDKDYDATYPAWNYGLEQVFDADGNPTIAQIEIEYPLDLQKQVDTNTWLIQQLEKQIQALLGD